MTDFCLYKKGGRTSLKYEIDLIKQQIDILFDTTPTEVLGQLDFGTKYDSYLYNLKFSAANMQRVVENDLSKLTLFGWHYDVKVYLLDGIERDIIVIDINLSKGGQSIQKTYKIV